MKAAKRRILWTALSCGLALLEPGLFMLTLGSVCWGGVEIYGTDNRLLPILPGVGRVLTLAALGVGICPAVRASSSPGAFEPQRFTDRITDKKWIQRRRQLPSEKNFSFFW